MDNKMHILCYGDSNTWGCSAATGTRYGDDTRWTRQLAARLGEAYLVIEEGLGGRTTVFEDPLNEGLSGIAPLTPILLSHVPLDLLVVMLGTNDCKVRFSATPRNIADGLRRLVRKAAQLDAWRGKPIILIVAPIIMDERLYQNEEVSQSMGPLCVEKSRTLPALMKGIALEMGCAFMDCNPYVKAGHPDYMHFDPQSNTPFAEALAEKVRELIG